MFALLFLAVLFISALYFLTRKHEVDKLPGPRTVPLFGNALSFATGREEAFREMTRLAKVHWPIFRTWMGPTPVIHPSDPKIVEIVLTSSQHITKSLEYGFITEWLGTGLLTSTGSKWHARRKMLTPSFHFKILEQFVPVFSDNTAILVDIIKKKVKNKSGAINIVPLVTHCALDIICQTAMGTSVNAQTDSDSEYVSAMYEIAELIVHRMLRPWLHPDWIHNLTPTGKNFKRCLKTLHSFTDNVIKERKAEYRVIKASGKKMEEEDDLGVKKRIAFLDLLLKVSEESEGLNDEDIREEVDTFMFEGHDTTAMAMSWALYYLGCYPDVQQKCFEEMEEIFGSDDRKPNFNDLSLMKYLERVIKETLRLRPSVFMIGRQVNTNLEIDGYSFPKGTGVHLNIQSIHQNPEVFPEPEKFDPERFSPENSRGRHPYAFVPFSAGPRNCIGQKFAMLEQKTLLSTMIRNFRVKTVNPQKSGVYIPDLILRPKNGVELEITPRD